MNLVQNLTLADQSVIELYGLHRRELYDYLVTAERKPASIIESVLHTYCQKQNKPGWLEKTPNHLRNVKRIKEYFPAARFIQIVRDPRDSALSMGKLPWAPESALANAYILRQWYDEFLAQVNEIPSSDLFTIRCEDLVDDPKTVTQSVCDFLNLEFDPAMLDTTGGSERVGSKNEPWKAQVSDALDKSRNYNWKTVLQPGVAHAIAVVLDDFINKHGYEAPASPQPRFLPCVGLDPRDIESMEASVSSLINTGSVPKIIPVTEALRLRKWYYVKAGRRVSRHRLVNAIVTAARLSPFHAVKRLPGNPEAVV